MDTFEPIREAATRLRADLLTLGLTSALSMDVVRAAADKLEIGIFWVAPGDPVLMGARAVLDEQTGAIFAEDIGDNAQRSALLAHEIGHCILHEKASAHCGDVDVDPSRSMEVAPVGLQRVESYGARERCELQANVFAREFLLPRADARRLHLDEGFGATAIAEMLSIPKDLVRQQLLDELLLPHAPLDQPSPTGERSPPRHDDSQDVAATHRTGAFQLQAGPGTGKTRTLVKRVLSLLDQRTDPSSILILTFSNRAAGEIFERVSRAAPTAAPHIWMGTFHAFGLELTRRYHDQLRLPPDPPLFDRSDAIEVLEELLPTLPLVHYRNLWDPTLNLRDIVGAISRAKDELVDAAAYRALTEAMRAKAGTEETFGKCLEIALVYEQYEKALAAHGAVDFGDLIMRPALLLEANQTIRTTVQLQHRHVLVDEYQDVNRASGRLLRSIAGDGRRLWVVGDARQSIYRFRGASSSNMTSFVSEYPEANVSQLAVNYRSSQEIVDSLTVFAREMSASAGMLPLSLTADRGAAGIRPELRAFEKPTDELGGIAKSIKELESAGVALRDQAVLCRTNSRLNDVAAALEVRGIPVLHLGSFFERDEIRDLLALMTLVVDAFGDGLARVGVMERYGLSLQDVYVAGRKLRSATGTAASKLATIAAEPELSPHGREALAKMATDVGDFTSRTSPWEFLTSYLLDRTDLAARLSREAGPAAQMRGLAIWQLLNFVRERSPAKVGPPIRRTLAQVRQMVLLAEERDLRQIPPPALHLDAVRLLTVHGSKGLEFEAVHVPTLTSIGFPTTFRAARCPLPDGLIEGIDASDEHMKHAHAQEEECLLFVAASRARTHLRLYHPQKQESGSNRQPSPFLSVFPALQKSGAQVMLAPPGAFVVPRIAVTWPADAELSGSQIEQFEKCARRFFYTHVLGLGGGRAPTAFTRTHDCLYRLLDWLAEARADGEPEPGAVETQFDYIWQENGPIEHAFATDYRELALRLVRTLVKSGEGIRFRAPEPLPLKLAGRRVVVEPDEIGETRDGTVVLRRIRTGHKRSDEYDKLLYTLYHLAAREAYGSDYRFEAVHLTDATREPVPVTDTKVANRRAKSEKMLASIAAGDFPPSVDSVRCPRCPHFFACDATPHGPLTVTARSDGD